MLHFLFDDAVDFGLHLWSESWRILLQINVDMLSGVRGVQSEDLQRGERPPDLWEVLPPLGNESLPADASRDELAMQLKVREALIKDAVKEVEVFTDDPEAVRARRFEDRLPIKWLAHSTESGFSN